MVVDSNNYLSQYIFNNDSSFGGGIITLILLALFAILAGVGAFSVVFLQEQLQQASYHWVQKCCNKSSYVQLKSDMLYRVLLRSYMLAS